MQSVYHWNVSFLVIGTLKGKVMFTLTGGDALVLHGRQIPGQFQSGLSITSPP